MPDKLFNKILIANRGEIAVRVIRACKELDILSVAVYSEADRDSLHVKLADEAICIGPSNPKQSYLCFSAIISAAEITGADAIHPGYGFLSENAEFSEICEANNITFIGASPENIRLMGNKSQAKKTMKKLSVPTIPGSEGVVSTEKQLLETSKTVGYPLLLKASAGGGGKGMRIVNEEKDLLNSYNAAYNEAKSAFGNGDIYVEKVIQSPRHIEIQVLADTHGNVIHLFERECSVQRRHQKVVEEAPSVVLTPEIRKAMGEAAVKVAKACDYVGAGTVEFLLDDQKNFYFLEMNTRLQVEHPVSELITGIDLVEQQIKVARGEKLSIRQEDLTIKGHALELRIYAEDPLDNFLPSVGTLETYIRPTGEGVRLDDGYEEGMEIPIYYDPMIAKLITYGKTREEATQLMIKAIQDYKIEGIATTLPFGKFVCEHEAFTSGNFDTHFVKNYYSPEKIKAQQAAETEIAAAVGLRLFLENKRQLVVADNGMSNWKVNRL